MATSRSRIKFAFDPDAFMEGTKHMSASQRGGYIAMLCYQWKWGFIQKSRTEIQKITGLNKYVHSELNDLKVIMKKFVLVEHNSYPNGVYINLRMERERKKKKAISNTRSEAAIKRWEKIKGVASAENADDATEPVILAQPKKNIRSMFGDQQFILSKNDVAIVLSILFKELNETTWISALTESVGCESDYPMRKWKPFSETILGETSAYIEQKLTFSALFTKSKKHYANWLKTEKTNERNAVNTTAKPRATSSIYGFAKGDRHKDEW